MHPYALKNLAMALLTRFDYLGRTEDLDGPIALARESVPVSSDVGGEGSDNSQPNSVSFRFLPSDRG